MLSSKLLVVAFLLGASLTGSYGNTSDDDDDELTKKIKERYKALCYSNLCRENAGKPVKEVFDTEDGYVTIELSCPKESAEEERKCLEGYHDNGNKCEDIDECQEPANSHNCSLNAICTNTRGSFNCTCSVGYHGDGVTCNNCTIIFDFENDTLTGWTRTGTAFDNQPTYGDNPTARNRGQPSAHLGDWWIGSCENRSSPSDRAGAMQGDPPQGTLTSPPFVIRSTKLFFLIGGGGDISVVRAELLISGLAVVRKTGKRNETMAVSHWDVGAYQGQEARLRLVDNSSRGWGHINFDHLSDGSGC